MLEMFPYSFSGAVTSHSDPNMAPQDANMKAFLSVTKDKLQYTNAFTKLFHKNIVCPVKQRCNWLLRREELLLEDFFRFLRRLFQNKLEKKTQAGFPPLLCFALCILNNFVIILSKLLTPHIAYSREVQRKASLV